MSALWKTLAARTPNRNIGLFYLISVLTATGFIGGNWFFFWTRYMTYGQLGLLDGFAFAVGVFLEVPTGAVGDMLGRRRTIISGMAITTAAIWGMTLSDSFEALAAFFLFAQLGWALLSGTTEAFAYDSLQAKGQTERFAEVISTTQVLRIAVGTITVLMGAGLYALHYRFPHYAWATAYTLGMGVSFFIQDPPTDYKPFSIREYFIQLRQGFIQLVRPTLRPYVLLMFALSGIAFLFVAGLIRPAIAAYFGFGAVEQGVLETIFGVAAAVSVGFVPRLHRWFGDWASLVILTGGLGLCFIGAGFPLGFYGAFCLLMITIIGSASHPLISIIVNREVESEYRATTLSTIALLSKVPYAITAPLAGFLAQSGKLGSFNIGMGALLLASIGVTITLLPRPHAANPSAATPPQTLLPNAPETSPIGERPPS